MINIAFIWSFFKKFKSTWDSLDLEFKRQEYKDWLFKIGWIMFLLTKIVFIQRRNEVWDCTCYFLSVFYVLLIGLDYWQVKSSYSTMTNDQILTELLSKISGIDQKASRVSINTLILMLDKYTENKVMLQN